MLRLIHSFDVKSGVEAESFIAWLDAELWRRSREFGCLERKTWIYMDGLEGDYENNRPVKRPRYLHEAFWRNQEGAENFRRWLLSRDATEFRRRWFDGITNHTVLRYLDYEGRPLTGDD